MKHLKHIRSEFSEAQRQVLVDVFFEIQQNGYYDVDMIHVDEFKDMLDFRTSYRYVFGAWLLGEHGIMYPVYLDTFRFIRRLKTLGITSPIRLIILASAMKRVADNYISGQLFVAQDCLERLGVQRARFTDAVARMKKHDSFVAATSKSRNAVNKRSVYLEDNLRGHYAAYRLQFKRTTYDEKKTINAKQKA